MMPPSQIRFFDFALIWTNQELCHLTVETLHAAVAASEYVFSMLCKCRGVLQSAMLV